MSAFTETPVPYDRHCDEVGTFKDIVAVALAPDADNEDAPGIVSGGLEQIATDLYLLSTVLGDEAAAAAAPIRPAILRQAAIGIMGRVDALKQFAENKLMVRWRYEEDPVVEKAKRDLKVLNEAARVAAAGGGQ